uniref:Uncharacterized protein n=1 Tax=Pseudoalteromonas luteoviolacea TaxID=43657 RepID=A0A023PYS4_9GAMM|nr:hypothetical protein [Pseudoalteromonas luteoviolacea]
MALKYSEKRLFLGITDEYMCKVKLTYLKCTQKRANFDIKKEANKPLFSNKVSN